MKLFKYSILVFSLLFLSCQTDDDNASLNSDPNGENFSENFGVQKTASFFGTVRDEDGNPLSGVEISIASQMKVTDDNGVFYVENASVNEKFAYLKASKSGYFIGSRALVPSDGINNVSITMLTKSITSAVSSGQDAIVSLPNGATVELDGNYILVDGSNYTGNVNVYMKFLVPVDEDLFSIMPGMLYGQDNSGEERGLDTYGMLAVELESSNG